jgi:hypothetical protein
MKEREIKTNEGWKKKRAKEVTEKNGEREAVRSFWGGGRISLEHITCISYMESKKVHAECINK